MGPVRSLSVLARFVAVTLLLGLLAMTAGGVALADSPAGQGKLVAQAIDGMPKRGAPTPAVGVTPEHTVSCTGGSNYTKWGSDWVGYNSATQASAIVDWIGVRSTLQKRSGSWPFYSWNDVGTTGWHDVPNDSYAGIASEGTGLSAGRYRVKGNHYCTLYGHVPERVDLTSYSGEFDLP